MSLGVAAVVVIVVVAAVAVFLLNGSSPEEVLASTTSAVKQVSSMAFSMDMDTEMDGTATPMHLEGVMAYPADSEFTMSMDLLGQTVSYDQITVGGIAYVKYPLFPTWGYTTLDMTTSSPGQSASPTTYLAYLESIAGIEDLGNDSVDGVECYHYAIDVDELGIVDVMLAQAADAGVDFELTEEMDYLLRDLYEYSEITVEVWIGIEDSLPRREVIDMKMGQSVDYTVHGDIVFSDFDADVEIVAPEGAVPIDELLGMMSGSK
jgi:hypothetical protein